MLVIPKISKWGRKAGAISMGSKGLPAGTRYIRAYQKAGGKSQNSKPCGRRRLRFYQGQHRSAYRKAA